MDAKKPRPNLLNVAQRAGVSPATVSRVINNTAPVRESVRARVLSTIAELGYEPTFSHPNTRTLENAIALVIPDILNPYFAEMVRGVQDDASTHGFFPVLLDCNEDPKREEQLLRMFSTQPMCGIIVLGSRLAPDDLLAVLKQSHTPTVVINCSVRHPRIACIRVDLESATIHATRHLIDLNHKRIAYLAGPFQSEQSLARRRGVERALAEAGLQLSPELCSAGFPNVDGGFQAMSALLALAPAGRPTAVITYNDLMALGALHAIRVHHLRVPEDISIIGIDDIAMAAHANPPLTTIAQPKYRMGRLAMQTMYRMLQGHPPPEESFTLLESPLIVRESTAPASNGVNR